MKKRTFTLLELVIVLLILGALTALSVSQYMGSQKLSKMRVFEANVNEVTKALSVYRSNQVLYGNLAGAYPTSLSDPQLSALFNQEPKNPYTNKSMLSDNPAETGIQYVSDGLSYKLCIVQRDVDDVNNNGVVEEVLPLITPNTCIGSATSNKRFNYYYVFDRNEGQANDNIVEWVTDPNGPSPALHVKRTIPYPTSGGCFYVFIITDPNPPITPSKQYTFSLWSKSNKPLTLRFHWYDSNNTIIGKEIRLSIPSSDNWRPYVYTVTAPANAQRIGMYEGAMGGIEIGVHDINNGDTYEFYIADVQLEEKP